MTTPGKCYSLKEGQEPPEGARVYDYTWVTQGGQVRHRSKYYMPVVTRKPRAPETKPRRRKYKTRCIALLRTLDEETCAEAFELLTALAATTESGS